MSTVVDALLVVSSLAGGVFYWFGYRAYRLPEQLGRRPFVALTGVIGTGCVVVGVTGLVPSLLSIAVEDSAWEQLALLFWVLATLPWFVFAVTYTGLRARLSARTLGGLGVVYLLVTVDLLQSAFDAVYVPLVDVPAAVAFLCVLSLAVSGAYLLLTNTATYGHTTVWQGVALAAVVLGSLVTWNFIGLSTNGVPERAGTFATGAVVAAAGVGTAWHRYGLFETAPSVGTLGERALTGATDDLMFVVDDEDRLITVNEPALETLSVGDATVHGASLTTVLGQGSEQLRAAETVTVQTAAGTRRYDPQVAPIQDGHGNDVGATLSLRDVTERERREQRLTVLNRVLRHNLRNEVDVLKAHAEGLTRADVEVTPILEAADRIAALGRQARRTDEYVSETAVDTAVDLEALVGEALETVEADASEPTVTVETPATASVTTNRAAVVAALESALENALDYATTAVTVTVEEAPAGYVVRVADDGPGIPESELASLDAATESPLGHSTGLGLWQLKWAITTLNGELSFDTTDGTTVEFLVPDRVDDREGT
jgi:signal transduction histidine kinase